MVIFVTKENLETGLSEEEVNKVRLQQMKNSDAWKNHAQLHEQAGLGRAELHISDEPLFGERDAVRERLGLPGKEKQQEQVSISREQRETVTYGTQHQQGQHVSYTSAGSNPGLWASCNCGAEFRAEQKGGELQVKSYGVVGTESSSTQYTFAPTTTTYSGAETSLGYKKEEKRTSTYV